MSDYIDPDQVHQVDLGLQDAHNAQKFNAHCLNVQLNNVHLAKWQHMCQMKSFIKLRIEETETKTVLAFVMLNL